MNALGGGFLSRLLEKDAEFKGIYEAHRSYEKKVAKLGKRPHLTTEEELEKKKLQKLKLTHKDKMEEIISRYREARG